MFVLLKLLAIWVLLTLAECVKKPQVFIRCNKGDGECLETSSQMVYNHLFRIKTLDPGRYKEISGSFKKYNYNFTGVTSTGLKNCLIESIRLNKNSLEVGLLCANLTFCGKYNIHGELIGKKIKDASTFVTRTSTYMLGVTARVVEVLGNDKKKHLQLDNIETYSTAIGQIRLSLKNSSALESFLNFIWRLTSKVVDHSFMDAILKDLVKTANEFLKTIPINDLFAPSSPKTNCVVC